MGEPPLSIETLHSLIDRLNELGEYVPKFSYDTDEYEEWRSDHEAEIRDLGYWICE